MAVDESTEPQELKLVIEPVLFYFSVPQLDELLGREATRQLLVHRPLRRSHHVPDLRNNSARNRQLEESRQVISFFFPVIFGFNKLSPFCWGPGIKPRVS